MNTVATLSPARSRLPGWRSPLSAGYLVRRIVFAIVTIWLVASIVFVALIATGNPVQLLVDPETSPEEKARISQVLGFDQPWYVQYFRFIRGLFNGQFPESLRYKQDAFQIVLEKVPASITLGFTGLIVGLALGILVGYFSAISKNRLLQQLPMTTATVLDAVPTFFLGVLLILAFGVVLQVLPISGSGTPAHLVLPATVLAITVAAPVARILRASLFDTVAMDHVTAAKARGLSPVLLNFRHVFVNALSPTLNLAGVQTGMVFGGAVIVESLFRWPGVGQLSISAIQNRDYPLVVASVLVLSTGFVLITLLVDLASAALDPRTKS